MASEEYNEIEKKYRGLDPGSLHKKDVKNRRTTWSHTTAGLTSGASSVLSHGVTSPYHVPVGSYHTRKGFRQDVKAKISGSVLDEKGLQRKDVSALNRAEDIWSGVQKGAGGQDMVSKAYSNCKKLFGLK